MKSFFQATALAAIMTLGPLMVGGTGEALAQAANPCAPKAKSANPCAPKAANPCAANPCAPKAANPCAAGADVDPKLVTRPKGTKLATGNRAELVKQGKALFNDTKLSTNDMSCATCHANNDNFSASFAKPYPHAVEMAKEKAGLKRVNLDEFVQFCMVVPMASKPLGWESRELAALTAYTSDLQAQFRKQPTKKGGPSAAGANPCAPKAANPCAPKAANPCAPKK